MLQIQTQIKEDVIYMQTATLLGKVTLVTVGSRGIGAVIVKQ